MKKITTFLALLLTCIIGATAADFVPKDGTKYLIKCKGNSNVVYTPENSNILQAQQGVTEASYFTIERKVVEKVTYFYIHPAGDATKYVYTAETPSGNEGQNSSLNDGVVGVTSSVDDATCLWKIAFNTKTSAFNITPKGYDEYSWNCRSKGIGYWTTRYKNNEADNSWYITPNVVLNGYYTIKNTATDRRTNLYNDFGVDNTTCAAENLPTPLTNNYVWHITTANNNVLTVLNGEGTPLYHDGNASLPTLKVAYSDGTKYYFGEALNCGNSGRNYKLTLWTDGDYSVADNQWTFAPVDASNIYNVVCNIDGGYVTYNTTSEKAKNGGFFFISSTPEVANFTAATVDYYEPATVSIDGNNIKVNYAYNLEAVKQLANEALAKTGAGYPTADAATRTALVAAVAGTDAAAIVTALEAFKNDKTSIQMPEDGKAYVITNIHKTGGKRYMKYQEDGTSMIVRGEGELPIEATYICHKVGDKYVFANNSGTYLTWRGNATGDCTNSNKGYTTSYNADYNPFTVAANPNVFGCLSFGAKRGNEESTSQSYYIVTRAGSFEKAGLDNYYDDNNSSAFTFEEVTYPNTITFNDAQNINGVSHIATFSAPFATIIPADVKAYYVSAKGTEATMTAIDAEAIPANQGVILTSESGAAATMVPAAGETAATITGNQLGHSAGAAKALTAGEGYILGNGTEGTAFYPCKAGSLPINKAYLLGNGGESAIAMNFGNAVTGINTIAAPASAKAPIFDLSGRRVVKATKGLYIQNGKKVIVK